MHMVFGRLRPKSGFRILLLHDVPESQWRALVDLVDYVRRLHGVLAPDDAAAWVIGEPFTPPPGKLGHAPVLFTFDDGFASNARLAREVLEPAGIRALFFVCPGLMDLGPEAQREAIAQRIFDGRMTAADLDAEQRLMTWQEVGDLAAAGHAIGAHSLTHSRLNGLTGQVLRDEIVESGTRIEDRLSVRVPWFAYPFGDIGSINREAISIIASRYPLCRTGIRGANRSGDHPLTLRADHIDLGDPFVYQRMALEGGMDLRYFPARWRLAGLVPRKGRQ